MRVLDETAAARTWNTILARQGLADSARLSTAWQVADAVLGLHAARLPSPFAIVAARTTHPGVPASLFTSPVRATLITVRCMRKTLHTLPLPLAAAAHVATAGFRERDARRAVLNAGYTPTVIEPVIGQLCALLQDGPLTHRAIEARLAAAGTEIPAGRLAIKMAWERGTIAYSNAAATWNREVRTFALTAAAYPALDISLTREQAITELVTAYLDRYGPATTRDVTWWSGLSAADITKALRRCGRPVKTILTPWSDQPCLMFADQTPVSPEDDAAPTGVQFLAHEDSALKAYFQTRDRYLADLPQQRAFNQIGEARPCILLDGVIAGTWSWNARTARVDTDLIPGRCPAPARRQVKVRAAALTETLRAGWDRRPAP
jgi:Winged helix DNA-binding domain